MQAHEASASGDELRAAAFLDAIDSLRANLVLWVINFSKKSMKRFVIINVICALAYWISSFFLCPILASCCGALDDIFSYPLIISLVPLYVILAFLLFIVIILICRKMKSSGKFVEFARRLRVPRMLVTLLTMIVAVSLSIACQYAKYGDSQYDRTGSFIMADGNLYDDFGFKVIDVQHELFFKGVDARGFPVLVGVSYQMEYDSKWRTYDVSHISYHYYDLDGNFQGSVRDEIVHTISSSCLRYEDIDWFSNRVQELSGTMVNYYIYD